MNDCHFVPSSPNPPPGSPPDLGGGLRIWLESLEEPLSLGSLFPAPGALEVELGSGDGGFILQYARRHPERNFLAVERLLGRLRKIDRKGVRAGLLNLRCLRIESAYFLEYLLPPESIAALHIYFPDPWPKRKHRRLRLINERFPLLAERVLIPSGRVYLRTDDLDYFSQMRAVFAASTVFRPVESPLELLETVTDFEREFLKRGIPTQRLALEKPAACPPA